MKKLFTYAAFLMLLAVASQTLNAQGTWVTRASCPITFAGGTFNIIGDTGYLAYGFSGGFLQTSIRKYSISDNSWSTHHDPTPSFKQEPYFTTIGSTGFLGGGFDGFGISVGHEEVTAPPYFLSSLASMPGSLGGYRPFYFTLGGKNYVGGGQTSTTAPSTVKAFYEYDPSTNAWTQKADFPDTVRLSGSFAVGGNGYVAAPRVRRNGGEMLTRDVQRYNPGTNSWTKLNDFPGNPGTDRKGYFVSKGMILGGSGATANPLKDVWMYDHGTDLWFRMANYSGGNGDFGQMGFVKDGQLYFGMGVDLATFSTTNSDFYRYTPDTLWEWGGFVDSNWHNPANWLQGSVPGATKSVIIPNAASGRFPIIDSGEHVFVNNIGIVSGGRLDIRDTSSITCKYAFTNRGVVELSHFASLVMSEDGTHIGSTGKWIVHKQGHSNPLRYNYWSSPFPSFSTSNLGGNPADRYKLPEGSDDVSDWINSPNETMVIGKGYISAGSGNVVFEHNGAPRNGVATAPARPTTTGTYNLFGNPYLSPLSAKDVKAFNGSIMNGNTFYFWAQTVDATGNNFNAGDYATYNTATSTGVAGSGSNAGSEIPNGFIGTCQGFVVENGTSAGLFAFTNDMRINYNRQFLKKENPTVRINIGNNAGAFNQIGVVFFDGATTGFDNEFDSKKLSGNGNLSLYTLADDKQLSINALGSGDENAIVNMGLKAGAGSYRLWLNDATEWDDRELWLEDRGAGKWTNLLNDVYWVYFDKPVTLNDRFVLHFKKTAAAAQVTNSDVAKVWFNSNELNIQPLVKDLEIKSAIMTDAAGKQVALGNLSTNGQGWSSNLGNIAAGTYLVSLETNVGVKSYKLMFTGK